MKCKSHKTFNYKRLDRQPDGLSVVTNNVASAGYSFMIKKGLTNSGLCDIRSVTCENS
jgi:hypothetical protein